jgi:hypothetical protein
VRRDALPLLGFAAVLGVLDALLWWYGPTRLAGLLLALPAVVALAAAAALALSRAGSGGRRIVPDLSLATVLLAVGVGFAAGGVIFGLWLCVIGAGLAAVAALGIVRELRAAPGARP